MSAERWQAVRLRPPDIEGLEIWNQPVQGELFWERAGSSCVERLRREGRSDAEISDRISGTVVEVALGLRPRLRFDTLYVAGGLVELPGVREQLQARAVDLLLVVGAGRFVGERGGFALLAERGLSGGGVVDVGQTAVKVSAPGGRLWRERDLTAVPRWLIGDPRPAGTAHVEAAVGFIADAIALLLQQARPADPALLLGLPCPLDDALTPGSCTYGWEGHAVVPRILDAVDARANPWPGERPSAFVLNDAELAAESARRDAAVPPGRILCITLGFGPGGALVRK